MSIIEKQLKNVVFADLSNFNKETNTYHIPKYTKPVYNVGTCYLIRVSKEVIGNTQSVVATNWNNGFAPKHEYYKAYVSKAVGKMIYCDCLAVDYFARKDLDIIYSGWFCIDDIIQVEVGRK